MVLLLLLFRVTSPLSVTCRKGPLLLFDKLTCAGTPVFFMDVAQLQNWKGNKEQEKELIGPLGNCNNSL